MLLGLTPPFLRSKLFTDMKLDQLLIATGNKGKVAELRRLLSATSIRLIDLSNFADVEPVAETGSTFRENAELKAAGYSAATGLFAMADDSGLEIEALDGRPGIFSARYGGDGLTDRERIDVVLNEMSLVANSVRTARFVSAISFADPSGNIMFTCEGECRGTIVEEARGTGGFGYDPIFVPEGFSETFGELSTEVKQRISHRARAISIFVRYLLDFNRL